MTEHPEKPPAGPTPIWSWRPLSKLAHLCAHHFSGDLRASFFSAALAVLALKIGALAIFTKLSLLAVSNQALPASTPANLAADGPLVLYLSETQWQQRYQERSPLDRCAMAEDLATILARGPRSLTVDFDLSPGLQEQGPACQARLDAVLDGHAGKLVLLMPFRVSSDALLARKAEWLRARCRAGAAFGDGGLNVSLGAVIDFLPESNSMADVVHERAGAGLCRELADAAGAERWLRRGEEPEPDDSGAEAINFAGFTGQVAALALEHPALGQVDNWAARDVFFGGDYGGSKDDRFLTPMGPLPGVAIHAAIAWSLAHPVHELPHMAGFVLDILTAFVFSLGIGFFWERYLHLSLRVGGFQRELSTVLVICFVGYFSLMLWLFFRLAVELFMRGVLIAPMLIGLSMLIDGFVRGPIAASLEAGPGRGAEAPAPAAIAPATMLSLLLGVAAAAVVVRLLHGLGEWPAVLLAVLAAVALDRAWAVLWRPSGHGHNVHGGHGDAAGSASRELWTPVGVASVAVLLAVAVDRQFDLRFGAVVSGFLGLNGVLLALLGAGLLFNVGKLRFERPERLLSWRMAGISLAPRGWQEWCGVLVFALRQAVYWAVVADALFVMLNH
ncbi:MAG: hypothetical protein V4462_10760 [Pseudomonadota bacterium]